MNEQTTVGLSPQVHETLRRLKEDGHFEDMKDAYRFGVALALARGAATISVIDRQTIFNIGTLDPDGRLQAIVGALLNQTEGIYKQIESLAEWGVTELGRLADKGPIPFAELLEDSHRNDG